MRARRHRQWAIGTRAKERRSRYIIAVIGHELRHIYASIIAEGVPRSSVWWTHRAPDDRAKPVEAIE